MSQLIKKRIRGKINITRERKRMKIDLKIGHQQRSRKGRSKMPRRQKRTLVIVHRVSQPTVTIRKSSRSFRMK